MKTIKEWLSLLPDEYRDKALYNLRRSVWQRSEMVKFCISDALHDAFSWSQTDDGYEFWGTLYHQLKSGTLTKKEKDTRGFGTFDKRFINWCKIC